jgi:hypothetical protein
MTSNRATPAHPFRVPWANSFARVFPPKPAPPARLPNLLAGGLARRFAATATVAIFAI